MRKEYEVKYLRLAFLCIMLWCVNLSDAYSQLTLKQAGPLAKLKDIDPNVELVLDRYKATPEHILGTLTRPSSENADESIISLLLTALHKL